MTLLSFSSVTLWKRKPAEKEEGHQEENAEYRGMANLATSLLAGAIFPLSSSRRESTVAGIMARSTTWGSISLPAVDWRPGSP